MINTHWGGVEETNAFGTHEFFDLVRECSAAEAYIAGNVGSGTPQEMAAVARVHDGGRRHDALANLRRANGRESRGRSHYFGVGNETWGCGGNMTPEYYADLYKRYATFLKAPEGNRPKRIASGGWNEHTNWTEALASGVSWAMDGISHHYYTTPSGVWEKKGDAVGFGEDEWISTLHRTMLIDDYLAANEAVLDAHDPEGKVGIYLDEWGTWYDPEEGREPAFLYQQNSIRDALVAALNFNIFHRHAERLHMANIAQTVNVLQAVILTDGAKMVRTPTYWAFEMYKPFKDATFVPIEPKDIGRYDLGDVSVPRVSASAALTGEGELVVALVNLHASEAIAVDVALHGFAAGAASGRVLTGDAIDAHNTFDLPEAVRPAPLSVDLANGLHATLPPRSVSVIRVSPRG